MGNTKSIKITDRKLLEPTYQVYSDTASWELPILRKMILEGKLAPFYPPVSEAPPHNTKMPHPPVTTTNKHDHHASTTTGTKQLFNRLLLKQPTSHHHHSESEPSSLDKIDEDAHPDAIPHEEYYDECPICLMFYQGGMNIAKCCHQRICSECYLQICKGGPKVAEINSVCPFCKAAPMRVDYNGPKSFLERCKELEEDQKVIQLKIQHEQEEKIKQEEERQKRLLNTSNASMADRTEISQGITNPSLNNSFTSTMNQSMVSTTSSNLSPIRPTPSSGHYTTLSNPLIQFFSNHREATVSTPYSPTVQPSQTFTPNMYQNNVLSRFFQRDDSDDDDETEDIFRYYYGLSNRVSTSNNRPAAGPVPSRNTNTINTSSHSSTQRNSQRTERSHFPQFSDFIPDAVDVTNVSADEEMLREAIRLSLLEQQTQTNTYVHITPIELGISPVSNFIQTRVTSPITSTAQHDNSPTNVDTSDTIINHSPSRLITVTNVENDEIDEELQMVLRLSMLEK